MRIEVLIVLTKNMPQYNPFTKLNFRQHIFSNRQKIKKLSPGAVEQITRNRLSNSFKKEKNLVPVKYYEFHSSEIEKMLLKWL